MEINVFPEESVDKTIFRNISHSFGSGRIVIVIVVVVVVVVVVVIVHVESTHNATKTHSIA